MKNIDHLICQLEEQYEGGDQNKRYNLELIPYVKYLEHYKE